MVPGWILKVSSMMARMGATVLKVSTMPISTKMTLWGLEKKVFTLLNRIVLLFARRVVDGFINRSSQSSAATGTPA